MAYWTPDLAGPAMLVDFSDAASRTLDGSDRYEAIADLSGNSRNGSQATAGNRPTRIAAALNGRDIARFNGTSTSLQVANAGPMSRNKDAIHVFAVRKHANTTGTQFYFTASTGTNNASARVVCGLDGGLGRNGGRRLDADAYLFDNQARDTAWHVEHLELGYAEGVWRYYRDGALIISTFSGTPSAGNSSATDSLATSIGANGTASGFFFNGDLAALAVFDAPLSADNRERLDGYFAHEFGLSDNLPAGHTFKAGAPFIWTGTTRDKLGALAARSVNVIKDSSKACVASATSDPITGAFSFILPAAAHTFVFSGEPDRNALVYTGVLPE